MARDAVGRWMEHNWKWAVPTALVGLLGLFAVFATALVLFIFSIIKSSGAYTMALERVQASPAVQEQLGRPIEAGWYVMGNVNVSGASGYASLSFPVSGPTGAGTVLVEAQKRRGEWVFEYLGVDVEGRGARIVLIADGL